MENNDIGVGVSTATVTVATVSVKLKDNAIIEERTDTEEKYR